MTSPSRKKRPTTRPSSTAATAPSAPRVEPLWLPAGWLAVVVALSASLASGAETPGWRPRGAARPAPIRHEALRPTAPAAAPAEHRPGRAVPATGWRGVRPVSYEDDIAGPALRVADSRGDSTRVERSVVREYRVAQQETDGFADQFGDALQDALERPFGADEPAAPADQRDGAEDEANRLFDDLPAEPEAATTEPDRFAPGMTDEPAPDMPSRGETDDDQFRRPGDAEPAGPESLPPTGGRPRDSDEDDDDLGRSFREPLTDGPSARFQQELAESSKDCSEGLAKLKANRLDAIDLRIAVSGKEGEDYPFICSIDDGTLAAPRVWSEVTYRWKASALCHKPLYFEQVALERYGHSWGPYLDPIVAGAHFFGEIPVLPYCMGLTPPNECIYSLGYYRPGSCAPYQIPAIPFSWRAALFEGGAAVGVAAFLP